MKFSNLMTTLKTIEWGVISLLEINNTLELLSTFQLIGEEIGKLIWKINLYEMFQYTKSHGLVSMQLLGVLGIFFETGVK